MADIKRLNYFTYQFLVEKDFDDEQAYHLQSRRRHNRLLHAWGVADGLDVTRTGAREVSVSAGTAIDKDGREIVLEQAQTHTWPETNDSGDEVYLTISYEEGFDPADHYTQGGVDNYTRTTESPLLQHSATRPPADGSKIVLARIELNDVREIESDSSIHNEERTLVGAKIAPMAINTTHLADRAVTAAKLAPNAVDALRIADGSIRTAELATGAVTTAKLADNAVTSAKIAEADGKSGQNKDVGSGIKTNHIQDGAVTLRKLAPQSVDGSKILDASIGSVELTNGAVTEAKLAANSVNTDKIVDGSVSLAKLKIRVVRGSVTVDPNEESTVVFGRSSSTDPNPVVPFILFSATPVTSFGNVEWAFTSFRGAQLTWGAPLTYGVILKNRSVIRVQCNYQYSVLI